MLKVLAVPAACLVLCGAAAAQDMPGLATLSPPDLARPITVDEPERAASIPDSTTTSTQASIQPGETADPRGLDESRAETGNPAVRGADPGATRAVAALRPPSGGARPWCAQERRVGTGAGFCLIN